MKKKLIYFCAGIAGGSVFIVEAAGVHLLAPFYGADLFLRSALVSVSLAALSAGFFWGGRLADKKPSRKKLGSFFCCAGFWLALVPWIKQPLFSVSEPAGLQVSMWILTAVLFFPPLFFLGTVNPFAIRMAKANKNNLASTTGDIFALSAVSGIFMFIPAVYLLIPMIGITRIFLIDGAALFITGGIILSSLKIQKVVAAGIISFTSASAIICFLPSPGSAVPAEGLLAVRKSTCGELRVIERESERMLLYNGIVRSATDNTGYISNLHSTAVMEIPKYFFSAPGKMLLLVIGTGSLIHQYTGEGWKVDAVENDPEIVRLTHEYFSLRRWNGTLVEMDARGFLGTSKDHYDVILLDLRNLAVPSNLITKEALELVSSHLNTGGITAVNIQTESWDDLILNKTTATLKTQFKNIIALPMEEPPDQSGDIVLLASDRVLNPLHEPEGNTILDPDWRFGSGYQKKHAWDNRFVPAAANISPITDDLNPVEIHEDIVNFEERQRFSAEFPDKRLLR